MSPAHPQSLNNPACEKVMNASIVSEDTNRPPRHQCDTTHSDRPISHKAAP